MDWLLLMASFAVFYRAGAQHLTFTQCAWLAGILSLAYMLTSLGSFLYVSRRNARMILMISTALSVAATVFCIFSSQFNTMLTGMAIMGICSAVFFNSYQAFMRGESAPGGLMRTISLYTLSWSMGCGLGCITSGFLYRFGISALTLFALAIGLTIMLIVFKHKRRPLEAMSSEEHIEEGPSCSRAVNARYVWIGWLLIFTGMFVQRPIFSFFPAISADSGISPFTASLPLFLNNAVQAFAGLAMARWRAALYRRFPLVIMHLAAAILFLAVWKQPTLAICFTVFSLLGVYFGFAFFCSVYYSSNSGNRVFNVGINEFLVGTAGLAGLFASEWWMRFTANAASMYAVCGVMLLVSVIIQLLVAGAGAKNQSSGRPAAASAQE